MCGLPWWGANVGGTRDTLLLKVQKAEIVCY